MPKVVAALREDELSEHHEDSSNDNSDSESEQLRRKPRRNTRKRPMRHCRIVGETKTTAVITPDALCDSSSDDEPRSRKTLRRSKAIPTLRRSTRVKARAHSTTRVSKSSDAKNRPSNARTRAVEETDGSSSEADERPKNNSSPRTAGNHKASDDKSPAAGWGTPVAPSGTSWGTPVDTTDRGSASHRIQATPRANAASWGTPVETTTNHGRGNNICDAAPRANAASWGTPVETTINHGRGNMCDAAPRANAASWGTPVETTINHDRANNICDAAPRANTGSWGTPVESTTNHGRANNICDAAPRANAGSWGTPVETTTNHGRGNNICDAAPRASTGSWGTPVEVMEQCQCGANGGAGAHNWGSKPLAFPTPQVKSKGPVATNVSISYNQEPVEIVHECQDAFLLRELFGSRLQISHHRIQPSSSDELPTVKSIQGANYFLIGRKDPQEKGEDGIMGLSSSMYRSLAVQTFYVQAASLSALQKELASVADFSRLPPRKICARMELLASPARWAPDHKHPYIFRCDALDDFEIIEENGHLGCGFVPQCWLAARFRNRQVNAIQVRIVGSQIGIFKGVLVEKNRISRIQLPSSMEKVGRSATEKRNREVHVLVNNIFPSSRNQYLEKHLNPNRPNPPQSSEKDNKPPSYMVERVLLENGVDGDYFKYYATNCRYWDGRKHSNCVGVRDPTGCLPSDKVFVSGLGVSLIGNPQKERQVFVARVPCTEKRDGRLLSSVMIRPRKMSKDDWKLLCELPAGFIVFPAPSEACPAIPPQIANGDLDGDLYFVFWDDEILRQITCPVPLGSSEQDIESRDTTWDYLMDQVFSYEIQGKPTLMEVVDYGNNEDSYRIRAVKDDKIEKVLSREELLEHCDEVECILGHRVTKKRGIEVQVQWRSNKSTEWRNVHGKDGLRGQIPDSLIQYAHEQGLTDVTGWRWVKKARCQRQDEALVEKVLDHSPETGEVTKIQIFWNDAETTWEFLHEFQSDKPDELIWYAQKQINSSSAVSWPDWVTRSVKATEKNWLENTQDFVSDLDNFTSVEKLVKWTHGQFQKTDLGSRESVVLGRAYKESLEIAKHGNRIEVPASMRKSLPKGSMRHVALKVGE